MSAPPQQQTASDNSKSTYVVKKIRFFSRTCKIVLQDINGPCPIVAIANVLSLRNELKLPSGLRDITQVQYAWRVPYPPSARSILWSCAALCLSLTAADTSLPYQRTTQPSTNNRASWSPMHLMPCCPLLSLTHTHSSLTTTTHQPYSTTLQSELVTSIVDLLLERAKHFDAAYAADYQQNISEIFPVLQKLTTGVDVNLKFQNMHAFEVGACWWVGAAVGGCFQGRVASSIQQCATASAASAVACAVACCLGTHSTPPTSN